MITRTEYVLKLLFKRTVITYVRIIYSIIIVKI